MSAARCAVNLSECRTGFCVIGPTRQMTVFTINAMKEQAVAALLLRQKAVFLFDDSIALASDCFQARALEDFKRASAVTDQIQLLKRAGGPVYALAPHAEHVGQELLSELKLVGPHSVMSHQQPPSEAGVYRMEPVADG